MKHQNNTTANQQNWQAYCDGSTQAFETIYNKLAGQLYLYGCKQTADTALVEDAIQDIFCKLFEGGQYLDNINNIHSYLLIALRNYIRKSISTGYRHEWHQKRFQAMLPETEEATYPSLSNHNSIHKTVRHAIDQLPSRQREVLYLRYYEGFDYDEISGIMNISYQVARNYASRGIKQLRAKLGPSRQLPAHYYPLQKAV